MACFVFPIIEAIPNCVNPRYLQRNATFMRYGATLNLARLPNDALIPLSMVSGVKRNEHQWTKMTQSRTGRSGIASRR